MEKSSSLYVHLLQGKICHKKFQNSTFFETSSHIESLQSTELSNLQKQSAVSETKGLSAYGVIILCSSDHNPFPRIRLLGSLYSDKCLC